MCPRCGVAFVAGNGHQRFCTKVCKDLYYYEPHGPLALTCIVCYEAFESKVPHARYCSNRCRRKAGKRQPAEAMRRRSAKKVKRLRPVVLERYGRTCYLCTRPILYGTDSVHPLALTLDHLLPVSMGGRDVVDNLRPAHRACNEDKGERAPTWWERQQAG